MTIDQRMQDVLEFYTPEVRPTPRTERVFPGRFEGKVALVTGGASGIGAATARRLAREGAVVAVLDRDGVGAEAVASELRADGSKAIAASIDVTDSIAVRDVVGDVIKRQGRIDVLVNSAGISQNKTWEEIEPTDWDRVFDINLKGLFFTTQAVAQHMVQQGGGRIVSLASIGGKRPGGNLHYGASKAGVISVTRSLALALAPHSITVNCVCPGYTLTPLTVRNELELSARGSVPAERTKRRLAEVPLGRYPLPDEVAGVICFLASDEADYMTGQAVNFCGGLHMTS
jgi:NAD(P)-dependent dehydrogenase (short-subunit alcohol dehydrogenase family)